MRCFYFLPFFIGVLLHALKFMGGGVVANMILETAQSLNSPSASLFNSTLGLTGHGLGTLTRA